MELIKISQLVYSKTNPRTIFDPVQDKELDQSIKENGVIVPLVVRDHLLKGKYEIIAGERRVRSCKRLKIEEVPCNIRDLNDQQVLEIQLIENINRDNLHPLDEAAGFANLREHIDLEDISKKTGKSLAYIKKRLKLIDLSLEFKESFKNNFIAIEHALLISRCSVEDQKELFVYMGCEKQRTPRTSDSIQNYIDQFIIRDLNRAPFSLKTIITDNAPACVDCPKRSGSDLELFDDIKSKNTCLDRKCFQDKIDETIRLKKDKWLKKGIEILEVSGDSWLTDKEKKENGDLLASNEYLIVKANDPDAINPKKAIIRHGKDIGKVVTICLNKDYGTGKVNDQKELEKKRKSQKKMKRRNKVNNIILDEISNIVNDYADKNDIGLYEMIHLVKYTFSRLESIYRSILFKRHNWEIELSGEYQYKDYDKSFFNIIDAVNTTSDREKTFMELFSLLIEMSLIGKVHSARENDIDNLNFRTIAYEIYGIDTTLIEKELDNTEKEDVS
jgi:ParB family chromosome partitioning protein